MKRTESTSSPQVEQPFHGIHSRFLTAERKVSG
jgi:hypothetical protein